MLAAVSGRNDRPALGRVRWLLEHGFERDPWSFDHVWEGVDPKLEAAQQKLYHAIGEAILDADAVSALDAFERWKEIEPIAPDQPWG